MIKAKATLKDDRPLYVFGLSARNLELLKEGRPIEINLEELDGVGTVLITYGATEASLARDMVAFIGPKTTVTGRPESAD